MSPSLPQRVLHRLKTYNEPLPLEDFEGYDGYWEGRERGEDTATVLPRWEIAVQKIPDGASVLDVGCGSGGFLKYLLSQRPNCTVRGTDISKHAVSLAAAQGLDTFQSDLTKESLDRQYDYITGFEMIEHVHEAEKVLVVMRDATRKRLIMSLPNTGYIEHRVRLALFGRFPNTQIKFHAKEHIRFWTAKDFRDWAAHFDLRVVEVQGQWGLPGLPWRSHPKMFSPQLVYTLERR
jgi:methionine biosynthesis protein MetW